MHSTNPCTTLALAVLFSCIAGPVWTNAAIWVSEDFSYDDGPIILQDSGVWEHTSGTEEEVLVENNQLRLSEDDSEDIMIRLTQTTDAPIPQDNPFYVSFVLRVDALPSGEGNYFAHFRGSSSSTYRGRLFLIPDTLENTTSYRLGVSNGSSGANEAILHPDALPLSQSCSVVMRFIPGEPSTVLWINPRSQSSPSVRAYDASTARTIEAFSFRQSRSQGNGSGNVAIDNLIIASSFEEVLASDAPVTKPPTEPPNQPAPSPTPTPSHLITVAPSNEVTIREGTEEVQIRFTRDLGLEIPLELTLTASEDLSLASELLDLPKTISLGSKESSAIWTIHPRDNNTIDPTTTIELQIETSDPSFRLERKTLILTILDNDRDGLLVSDEFNRPDGPLNQDHRWQTHSGAPGTTALKNGSLYLNQSKTEDINIVIPGSPFRTDETLSLFVGFDLTVLEAMPEAEIYFAHLKGRSKTAYRGRIYLRAHEVEGSQFQLGLEADPGDPPSYHPTALNPMRTYRVVMSYELATGIRRLWIDAATDADDPIQSVQSTSVIPIEAFAFRQTGSHPNNGDDMQIDNLEIGTTFENIAGTIPFLPRIEIRATRSTTSEEDQVPGTWLISRSGATSAPLSVNIQLTGTAERSKDFHILFDPQRIEFEPNQDELLLYLHPFDDDIPEASETVELSIERGLGYVARGLASAAIEIKDNDIAPTPPSISNPTLRIERGFLEIKGSVRTRYQLQQSEDLREWTTMRSLDGEGEPTRIPIDITLQGLQFYRLDWDEPTEE